MTSMVRHEGGNGTTAVTVQREQVSPASPVSFAEMIKMGDALVKTGFLPDHVRTGAQAAAIILTGQELGMPPMRALRALSMVKGKVVEAADSQLARFKTDGGHGSFRHGLCTFAGCKAKKDKDGRAEHLDDEHACIWLRHPNGDEHVELWTAEHSAKAGLGDMHKKYPRAMFRSRSITAGLKGIGWEGAVGAYDPDEAREFSGIEVQAPPTRKTAGPTEEQAEEIKRHLVTLGVTKDRGAYLDGILANPQGEGDYAEIVQALRDRVAAKEKRSAKVEPPAENDAPKPPPETKPEPPASSPPRLITDEQKTRLLNLCDKGGARTPDARLAIVSSLIGHEVQAIGALTEAEALEVLDVMSGAKEARRQETERVAAGEDDPATGDR